MQGPRKMYYITLSIYLSIYLSYFFELFSRSRAAISNFLNIFTYSTNIIIADTDNYVSLKIKCGC